MFRPVPYTEIMIDLVGETGGGSRDRRKVSCPIEILAGLERDRAELPLDSPHFASPIGLNPRFRMGCTLVSRESRASASPGLKWTPELGPWIAEVKV